MSKLPTRALRDLRVMAGTPIAVVIALLFVGGAVWATSAFPREEVRPAVPEITPLTDKETTEFDHWWDLQPAIANFPVSNDGAKVMIVEFAGRSARLRLDHARLEAGQQILTTTLDVELQHERPTAPDDGSATATD